MLISSNFFICLVNFFDLFEWNNKLRTTVFYPKKWGLPVEQGRSWVHSVDQTDTVEYFVDRIPDRLIVFEGGGIVRSNVKYNNPNVLGGGQKFALNFEISSFDFLSFKIEHF